MEGYFDRFNKVYNAIPPVIIPPPGLDLIHFLEGFDVDMVYQLKERDHTTLEEIQANSLKVQANLLAKKET